MEIWEIFAKYYNYNVCDAYGVYLGSADTIEEAEKIRDIYERESGIEAYVLNNMIDYTGRATP